MAAVPLKKLFHFVYLVKFVKLLITFCNRSFNFCAICLILNIGTLCILFFLLCSVQVVISLMLLWIFSYCFSVSVLFTSGPVSVFPSVCYGFNLLFFL